LTSSLIGVPRPSRLKQEIRQRRPFNSVGHEATLALLRTADLVRRRIAGVVGLEGLTGQQFNVLRILRGAGDAGLPTLEVAERMIEQTPGITRLLDRLEAKGFVRRQRCPKDRRQHLCWITPQGRTLLERLDQPAVTAAEDCVCGLTRKDQTTLIRLLDVIRSP
jgi:DNA-binding MarR family transcriptional regulator